MATITTSKGVVFQIDDEDLAEVSRYRWTTLFADKVYAKRNCKGTHILLHRQLLNATPGQFVDHINGDTTDCRKCNLRLVTLSQNAQNTRRHRDSKARYKGLSQASNGSWMSAICKNGRRTYLGLYKTQEEAARAYDAAAIALFGEFAKLNFPPPDQEKLLTFSN